MMMLGLSLAVLLLALPGIAADHSSAEGIASLHTEDEGSIAESVVSQNDQKRYEEALETLNISLKRSPNDALALQEKGSALNRLRRWQEALDCLNESLLIDPESPRAWKERGTALEGLGRLDESLRCINMSLLLDPGYAEAWMARATVLELKGSYEEANIAYRRAASLGAPGQIFLPPNSRIPASEADIAGARRLF